MAKAKKKIVQEEVQKEVKNNLKSVYSIRDSIGGVPKVDEETGEVVETPIFNIGFYASGDSVAERMFRGAVLAPDSAYQVAPDNWSLWKISEFDDELGFYKNLDKPVKIIEASEYFHEDTN